MTLARWLVLTVRVPSEELTEELAEGLVALGGSAVEEEANLLTTYVAAPADPDAFLAAAADRLEAIAGGDTEVVWRWQEDEDWSGRWREGLAPRRVGVRLVVTQPWNPVEPEAGQVVIVIDPATAFGTGEHATTRGALALLERALGPGDAVLDVGTGSGILAIAASRLGAGRVLAVESDPGSIDNARENLERNGVADHVILENAVVDLAYLDRTSAEGFDVIVANVSSGVLVPLLPDFASATRAGGRVILGGIMVEESGAVLDAATAAGLDPLEERVEGDWWTGLLRRD